ncbi:polysaccharide biosynthesis protein [Haemophilus parainfluenzae]|uniref:Nucleoside-diphosphate sugar epimerase/dehydratase n=1 Tax=Haemophilus parainfluenzae ATCC 33392 TaxID=888828 RepID=A0ABD7ZFR7_HAEPA|nr:nucleoside-diphosphate sugar epimerase/dehydratase [Haemophilus parainfluenzae]QQB23143.1 polysaccharide biosynthesis protein [Haemophilus parainfluenzae]WMS22915.1 nucleoside-diphosphate sugar epimerase/dehydratase [Haemophilus parainfluenzae ATCC 33392]
MLDYFVFELSRSKKRIISLVIDTILIITSFFFAYWTRLGDITAFDNHQIWFALTGTLIVTLIAFVKLGLYRAVLRYISFKALAMIAIGALISSISLVLFSFFIDSFIPRTVPLIYFSYVFLLCGGVRMLVRYYIGLLLDKDNDSILIYGAGSNGRQLAVMLKHSYRYRIRGFIDDNVKLYGTYLLGNKIFSPNDISKLVQKYHIKVILLAIPSASRSERKAIIDSLIPLKIKVQTIPDMEDILQGNAKIDELREVHIEDLLGREPVLPNKDLLQKNIHRKAVMVTGAGGSIGSELCRQIILNEPNALILFELSEFSLYSIHQELLEIAKKNNITNTKIYPVLGNVQDIERVDRVLSHFNIDSIYHTAAYKHVPLVEYNMIEGVQNNVFGTYNVARCAAEHGVKSFVLISTDKAVRPTNVMGASKRMAELCLQALSEQLKDYQTCFSMVRFGNVLGSSGSVIPLFRKQILKGGPITITHPDIIRYFMTIPEAAQLVIQAGAMAKGGDVFILDMGEPVKIVDLAKNLVQLSGLSVKDENNPKGDVEITYTGLRPGEKLYEELLIGGDNVRKTSHPRIMTAEEVYLPFEQLSEVLAELESSCRDANYMAIRQTLLNAPTGFNPTTEIVDVLYKD